MQQEDSITEILQQAVLLRHYLHQNPELSGGEFNTAQYIRSFLEKTDPSQIIDLAGGTGLAAIYNSQQPGPVILFRADTDALPFKEASEIPFYSGGKGVAHQCGHDGHAAILAGLALLLKQNQLPQGKVVLLFQPSEENGKGAEMILNDSAFANIKPDYVFALHNLPGFEKGSIVVNPDVFASASRGMIIRFTGKPAHAAYPEQGISPADALATTIRKLNKLCSYYEMFSSFVLLTVVYAEMGEAGFGTSPADALIMATMRSYDDHDMKIMILEAKQMVKEIAAQYHLKCSIEWSDEFDSTINDPEAVKVVAEAAKVNQFPVITKVEPFRWSEDFGRFTQKYKGAMFGLGAGKEHPPLHSEVYEFPDDVIETGIKMFWGIMQEINIKREDVV